MAELGLVGIFLDLYLLGLALGVVVNNELQRIENSHGARGVLIEIVSDARLEQAVVNNAVGLRHADAAYEVAYRGGGIAPAAHSAESDHSRVVPAVDNAVLNHFEALSLARHAVVEVQTCELDLARRLFKADSVDEPVIERPVILELERAQGVGDFLRSVGEGMREIVHRIDAPLVARLMMGDVRYSVDDGVAHIDVRARHVYLGAKHLFAVCKLALGHAAEQVEILLD